MERRTLLLNPPLIVEVLSSFTRDYDRGDKFAAYRGIASFQEYLAVDSTAVHIQHHVRGEDGATWTLNDHTDWNGSIHLASLNMVLALRDAYDDVLLN